jgi:hypothetical protein
MPISSSAIIATRIRGYLWKIDDENELASLVARVYLGHAQHVEKILRELHASDAKLPTSDGAVSSAKELLNGAADHRDGLLFQTLSWIAAQRSASKGDLIRIPHLIRAHKGFDGLQININAQDKLTAVVIFEDKATTESRETVRNKVWPSFKELEAGGRENELMQEVIALLGRAKNVDRDEIVHAIVWNQIRRYRLSITGDPVHGNAIRFRNLFKGYDTVVPGNRNKRTAAVLCFTDLRAWMTDFAKRVENALDKEKEAHV